jgi:hypothetical protein
MTSELFNPSASDMEAVHYGIPVSGYGEDGAMLALGHHDTRRAFAAFNRHARTSFGFVNFADERDARAEDWVGEVRYGWLSFYRGDPLGDFLWEGKVVDEGDPGAVAVTYLDVS